MKFKIDLKLFNRKAWYIQFLMHGPMFFAIFTSLMLQKQLKEIICKIFKIIFG